MMFYIVNSGGNYSPDNISSYFKKNLNPKNKKLNAGFRIVMPSNYIKIYDRQATDQINRLIDRSKADLEAISGIIKNNRDSVKKGRLPFIAGVMNSMWQSKVSNTDKNFYSDNKCNSCDTCARACPVNNIKILSGKPDWSHKCEECFACISYCPQKSIQCGRKTILRDRYRNPEISFNEIAGQKGIVK